MRDPWRMDGADVTEELLVLTSDERVRQALQVARDYCNHLATGSQLAEAHELALAAWRSHPDWSGYPALAAAWVTDDEPRWDMGATPWKILESAKKSGPAPLRTGD